MYAKYDIIIYAALTNPKVRYVRVVDGLIWENVAGELQRAPTYANTAITLTENAYINGIPITIPALPAGEYDMLIYDVASPANTDAVSVGKRIAWTGRSLLGLPQDL